ncbi:MAG: GAF domain-containing protein [archaeon]|nr:GAF domain-containing protein [archaeon]
MIKAVIISDKIQDLVSSSEMNGCTVSISSDLIQDTVNSLERNREKSGIVVIFISYEEYGDIDKFFSSGKFPNFVYNFVIFGNEKDLKSSINQNYFRISEFRISKISETEYQFIVHKTLMHLLEIHETRYDLNMYISQLTDTRQDQEDLINIGRSLSSEKDMDNLLRMILFLGKKITGADAGSIYLVEEDNNGVKRLRFKYSHTFSREIPLEEFVIDLNKKSIAGYVAVTGEVQNILDAYNIPDDSPYVFNSSFDKQHNYICRSMLVVPMKNHIDEIIGVIQLINSKEEFDGSIDHEGNEAFSIILETPEDFENHVVTFNKKYDSLLEAIAGQAAVAIENNRLINQIQNQFEEFVKASVTAIESRDPATSGHSFRVAELCKEMARAVDNIKEGYFKEFTFSENDIRELEFAALLHDFGKVYIDLSILKKAKKLFKTDFENLNLRLDYLYRFIELQYLHLETKFFEQQLEDGRLDISIKEMENEKNNTLNRIKEIKKIIKELNEPRVMDGDPETILNDIIDEIKEMECVNIDGECFDIISDNNILNLTIKRGSLNPMERREIESHVNHTHSFVSKIPWPSEYKNIPEISLRHHEKIDGTGYPDGLKGIDSTLIQSRMMAVADIYDAFAASDRPYKKAVPIDRVLIILQQEADDNKLDKNLVKLFIDEKIYEKVDKDSFKEEDKDAI